MPRAHWLTPEPPGDGFICRRLKIPDSLEFVALVTGALLSLQEQYNWEQYGTLTPAETTAYFREMIDDFALPGERTCRLIGEIVCFAGAGTPDYNWLPCDGRSLDIVSYPDLYAVISTTYGTEDSDHFNIPDLRGRSPLGVGNGPGLTPRGYGDNGGEEAHVLSIAELAGHTHTDVGHTHVESTATATLINGGLEAPAIAATAGLGTTGSGSANLDSTGGDFEHNTMHPFIVLPFWIVAQ